MSDDKRFDRIENKIDGINDKLGETNVILAEQHVSLKEHMRRTALLEKSIVPIQVHVNMVNGVLKAIGILAMLAAIAEVLLKLL